MKNLVLACAIILLSACSSGPKEIAYGVDNCDFCTMTITDKPYGTELVTDKGKVYKFDSVECMISYMNEHDDVPFAHVLTSTMDNPGPLQDVKTCSFLVSPNLPSPMGANITPYSTKEFAVKAQSEYQGEVYSFFQVQSIVKPNHGHTH
ncbi:hypothetical protein GO491_08990 [Flavobacteriaceae bacterium Ap0902]|nr:hypothetical protein [Flavobacteriaceae bacterium Ap0902]